MSVRNWPGHNPFNANRVVQLIKPQHKTRVYETCFILARTSWEQEATDFLFTPDKLSLGASRSSPLYLIELRLNSPNKTHNGDYRRNFYDILPEFMLSLQRKVAKDNNK